ncbi:PASTA domain-containing protein, partial [Mesorhizobium sp. M00.F.Ca.ET.186.01.1.1]
GTYVIAQSPAPGVKIEEGGKIRIHLGDKLSN